MSSTLTTPTCEKHNELKVLYGTKWKCKSCNREYQSSWFEENREVQRTRIRSNNDRYRLENRRYVWQYKLSHPCIDCGESDPVVLEFDHREPSKKSFNISAALNKSTLKKIISEIQKCDVRCANCHRRKTFFQFEYNRDLVDLEFK